MTLAECIAMLKDVLLGGAGVVGAVVAWRGLETWKRQLKGGVEYDLARRVLRCTYKYRAALEAVRNPLMLVSEMQPPPEEQRVRMNQDEIRHYGSKAGYQARWDAVSEALNNLETEILEAEVLWGAPSRTVFEPLFKLQHELSGAIYLYLRSTDPRQADDARKGLLDSLAGKRDIVFDLSGPEPDEFANDVGKAVRKVEDYVKPHLQK